MQEYLGLWLAKLKHGINTAKLMSLVGTKALFDCYLLIDGSEGDGAAKQHTAL